MDYLVDMQNGYTYKEVYEKAIKPKNEKLAKEEIIYHTNISESCLSKGQEDSNENQEDSDEVLDSDSDEY